MQEAIGPGCLARRRADRPALGELDHDGRVLDGTARRRRILQSTVPPRHAASGRRNRNCREGLLGAGNAFAQTAPAITPFTYVAPESALDDLKLRLARARLPERETVADWSQGVPLARLRALVEYWRTDYDWRRCEAMLDGFGQYRTEIDGLDVHFLHIRSRHANALPIIITHGWPGSVIEFFKIMRPLTDPTAHGGQAEDAFHVVAPSLPGFGFSDKPSERGWNSGRIARAWAELMRRLGYERYVAQGGDWGAHVTRKLAQQRPAGLAGIHLNMPFVIPEPVPAEGLSAAEQRAVDALRRFQSDGFGYFLLQATRPQTLGYALVDSPIGQAAWIYEKFQAWTDNDGDPESALTRDEMLDIITLYWLTETAASSARIYFENEAVGDYGGVVDIPWGAASSLARSSRRHAAGPNASMRTSFTGTSSIAAVISRRSSSRRFSHGSCARAFALCAEDGERAARARHR
jgi:epoxide hydrolase